MNNGHWKRAVEESKNGLACFNFEGTLLFPQQGYLDLVKDNEPDHYVIHGHFRCCMNYTNDVLVYASEQGIERLLEELNATPDRGWFVQHSPQEGGT